MIPLSKAEERGETDGENETERECGECEWKELRGQMKQRNKEMFSCLVLERLAPLDMMDEPKVWRDKSWTDGSDTHSDSNTAASRLKQEGHLVVESAAPP